MDVVGALTGAFGARDKSLARVAHLEDGGCLDVVPLLEGHGVHAVVRGQPQSRAKNAKESQERCKGDVCNTSLAIAQLA